MKTCQFCAERIREAAFKFRFCRTVQGQVAADAVATDILIRRESG